MSHNNISLALTVFPNIKASSKKEHTILWPEIVDLVNSTKVEKKDEAPMIKLATFGDIRSDKNCLRWDGNVLSVTGVEVDYDEKLISVSDAVEKLTAVGIKCFVYTSASHEASDPKWRIIAPFSISFTGLQDEMELYRKRNAAKIINLFDGLFDPASYKLSQSFYFGEVAEAEAYESFLIEGSFIDLLDLNDDIPDNIKSSKNINSVMMPSSSLAEHPIYQYLEQEKLIVGVDNGLVHIDGEQCPLGLHSSNTSDTQTSVFFNAGGFVSLNCFHAHDSLSGDRHETFMNWLPIEVRAASKAYIPVFDLEPLAEIFRPKPVLFNPTTPFSKLNKTIEWLDASALKTNPVISLATAIQIASGASARLYRSSEENHTTLFMALVSGTGTGKDYARRAIESVFRAANYEKLIGPGDFTSEAALLWYLGLNSPAFISVLDEFGDLVYHALSDQGGSAKVTLMKGLRRVYMLGRVAPTAMSQANLSPKARQNLKEMVTYDPCVGLLGLTTEKQFYDSLAKELALDGTLNRFIVIHNEGYKTRFNNTSESAPPDWLVKHVKTIRDVNINGVLTQSALESDSPAEWQTIPFSKEAMLLKEEIGDPEQPGTLLFRYCKENPDRMGMVNRWRENAMRLATALSVFEGHQEINRGTLDWCWDFVRHWGDDFITRFEDNSDRSAYSQLCDAYVQKLKKFPDGLTTTELQRIGPYRNQKAKERKEILEDLINAGLIEVKSTKSSKLQTYFAC